jgi:hypothetical protein
VGVGLLPLVERNPIGGARVEVREGSVVIPVIVVTDSTQRESVVPGSAEVVTRVDDGHCHALAMREIFFGRKRAPLDHRSAKQLANRVGKARARNVRMRATSVALRNWRARFDYEQ